ncbi:MAG: hypothetical protein ACFFD4_10700 [Candidatus Odinarchaeota archaeon]
MEATWVHPCWDLTGFRDIFLSCYRSIPLLLIPDRRIASFRMINPSQSYSWITGNMT